MKSFSLHAFKRMALCFLLFSCGDPATRIGQVCQTDEHCGNLEDSLRLRCDTTIPGGACVVSDCTPDDPATPEIDEDETSCPSGSRCVREYDYPSKDEDRYVCRKSCFQQSDCRETIICSEKCKTENLVETCKIECNNRMECRPFWYPLPTPLPDEVPRVCILQGRLYEM